MHFIKIIQTYIQISDHTIQKNQIYIYTYQDFRQIFEVKISGVFACGKAYCQSLNITYYRTNNDINDAM